MRPDILYWASLSPSGILKLLSGNTRIKIIEIASKLNSTARIIAYRIARMEREGIIQKYTIALNPSAIGISVFKSFIYLNGIKGKHRLMAYLAGQKNCIYNVEAIGNWDIEPEFEVHSTEEYYRIMDDIEEKFGGMIKNINTMLIEKEHKFIQLPEKISGRFESSDNG